MSFNFVDAGNNHEGLRINFIDFLIQLCQFPVGNDGHDDRLICMQISGFAMQDSRAAVQLLDDHLIDLFVLFAYDLDLSLDVSGEEYFVQNDGVDQNKENSVDDLLFVGEEHLENQDREVKEIEHDRHRETELFIQYKRRNIHSSGGCTCPDHDSDGKSDHESAADGCKHPVACDICKLRNLFKYTENDRVKETADQCCQCKHFSKDNCSKHKHNGVKTEDEHGNRDIKVMFKSNSKTSRSPGDQVIWKNEDDNTERIDGIADQDCNNIQYFFGNTLIHTCQSFLLRYESVYRKKRGGTRDFRKIRKSYQYDETVLY